MAVRPIIHCLLEREPKTFHVPDELGQTLTFSLNLAFEVESDGLAPEQDDEEAGERLFREFCARLDDVKFHYFQFRVDQGVTLGPMPLWQLSDAQFDGGTFVEWLRTRQSKAQSGRFWTTVRPNDPDAAVEATRADAFAHSRAVTAWDAPVGHRIHFTHLVRFPTGHDGDVVVLPYFAEPDGKPTYTVETPPPVLHDLGYLPAPGWVPVVCRTIAFDPWKTESPLHPTGPKPPGAIVDPDIDVNGFLELNEGAEQLSRFLDGFEARTSSLLSANAGLHFSGDDGIASLENRIGLGKTGTAPTVFNWGAASWYAMARLVSALDPWVIGLMQPGQHEDVGGAVLAPLAVTVLDALDTRRDTVPGIFDYEPRHVLSAVRKVLAARSPIAGGASGPLLARSVKHVFGITPALLDKDGTVVEQPDLALLALLVDDFHGAADGTAPDAAQEFLLGLRRGAAEILTVALEEYEQQLQDEAGAERALLRMIETSEFVDGAPSGPQDRFEEQLAARLVADTPTPMGPEATAAVLDGVREGWSRYREMLSGPFNGAEAIRRAASAAATRALLARAVTPLETGALADLVRDAEYYARRFDPSVSPGKCFETLAGALVIPAARGAVPDFRPELSRSYETAAGSAPLDSTRFLPDSFPRPLAIQIASGIDGTDLDLFARSFNGICVAMRRIDRVDSRWAYANLADLSPFKGDDFRGALHPVMPGATDGRGTMFLNYEGIPFADRPDLSGIDEGTYIAAPPFYEVSPHSFESGQFERLPRLAYGRYFESFSFVATNAGTIPRALQLHEDTPWLPNDRIEPLMDGSDHLGNPWERPTVIPYPYSRRTAISQMSIVEDDRLGEPGRIGRELAGVMPLSKDYPRLGTVARIDGAGTIDLFRDTDGMGRMAFPGAADASLAWSLSGLQASMPAVSLKIHLFDGAAQGPEARGFAEFDVEVGAIPSMDLQLRLDDISPEAMSGGKRPGRYVTLLVDGRFHEEYFLENPGETTERQCWIRMVVSAGSDGKVSISMVDPDGKRQGGQGVPLLLLAPEAEIPWNKGLAEPTHTVISTPRTGYADFSRWMANADLAIEALGGTGQRGGKGAQFMLALAAANRMRHRDKELARYLDTLPDPSVGRVSLELQATDSLRGERPSPDIAYFDVPKLATWLVGVDFDHIGQPTPEVLIREIFRKLDAHYRFELKLAKGSTLEISGGGGAFEASVPTGCVARLAMHALVPSRYFTTQAGHPPVFDEGMLQYATRRIGDDVAFEAGARLIETMFDGIEALAVNDHGLGSAMAADMVSVHQVPDTRRYDLVTGQEAGEPFYDHWRLISEIDVTTQRWRATGRPIYHFIEPRKYTAQDRDQSGHPALALTASSLPELSLIDRFEREAFFDRADVDAHTVTQRLSPLPASTILQEFPWEAPSATYFRHRFTLRSRYAGALTPKKQTSLAWRTKDDNLPTRSQAWTVRVAMLADRSRLKLTRPQLRGLIPLTSMPAATGNLMPAPPVAAVLQEPPFARGGLADRIASEIRTGFGYGFDQTREGEPVVPVKIQDSRKEIGPNPHLDYRPFPARRVLAMALQGEGPLGLTFDPVESSTPALPNSVVLIRPVSLDGESGLPLQEAMLGVSMRRYIDPAWLAGDALFTDSPEKTVRLQDASRCWWIELDRAGGLLSYARADDAPKAVLRIVDEGGVLVVSVWKAPVDSGVGEGDDPVEIGRARADEASRPRILHQETTPGNFLVSVLVDTGSSRTEDGEPNVPVAICSFEWSVPSEKDATRNGEPAARPLALIVDNYGTAFTVGETMASAATALRWTQIGRDFNFVSRLDRHLSGDRSKAVSIHSDLLRARTVGKRSVIFETKGNDGPADLCRSTAGNPYPSNVHRHVAMISSSFLGELGRSVEVFGRAALSTDAGQRFALDARRPEHALRVVEFETPAAIICSSDVQAPAAYRSAYFDLVRTGYEKGAGILLTLRFVGSRLHLGGFTSLSVALSQPGRETIVDHSISAASAPVTLHAYIDKGRVNSWIVYEDKTTLTLPPAETNLILDPTVVPGFHVRLKTQPSDAEFWADVSLLHGLLQVAGDGSHDDPFAVGFDFNWLFSPEAEGDPAALVSARGLSEMVEAQARIVSVSPPIPLDP